MENTNEGTESDGVQNESLLDSDNDENSMELEMAENSKTVATNTTPDGKSLQQSSKILMRTPSLIDDYLSDIEHGLSGRSQNTEVPPINAQSNVPVDTTETKNEPIKQEKVIVCVFDYVDKHSSIHKYHMYS